VHVRVPDNDDARGQVADNTFDHLTCDWNTPADNTCDEYDDVDDAERH